MKERFEKVTNFLKHLGFKGEVCVKSGLVIIGSFDRNSSSMIRKAFKMAKNSDSGTLTEVRGEDGRAAFVWVDDTVTFSKKEIKNIALAA